MSGRTHIHSADMCVTLPAGMWACGSHSGMLAHTCRFVLYLCRMKQNWQRLSHPVNLYAVKSVVIAGFFSEKKQTLTSALTLEHRQAGCSQTGEKMETHITSRFAGKLNY